MSAWRPRRIVAARVLSVLMLWPLVAASQQPAIDPALARQLFEEARAICERDNAKLWGVSLCGPMFLVDPQTREVVANQADREGKLTQKGDVFLGALPESENVGNTAITWAGVKWTMLLWPLPESLPARTTLIAHELFHRIQEQLGLPSPFVMSPHLDTREGRIWLQLEFRALRAALTLDDAARRRAIEDALNFRAQRHKLFPEGASRERALEMNEGLAEYTGLKLRGTPEQETIAYLAQRLGDAQKRPSFVRQSAYETGAAYGFLLDAVGADWRKSVKAEDDLGLLLARALPLTLPAEPAAAAEKRAKSYDGDALRAAETARENEQKKRMAEYRARFLDGPVLILPLVGKVGLSFDPYAVMSLGDSGTVYSTLRVTADWGILTVSAGALVVRAGEKGARVHVVAPADASARPLKGDGWTLDLASGWTLQPADRKGDLRAVRIEH